ncbi:MAG: glycosyltransferase family 39 protein, partial [Candidatus Binatia bacterium]
MSHGGAAALAALVALLLYLPGLGASDFLGDDEVLDAGIVRAMAEDGEWLYPDFAGQMIPKPPLFYWAAAATSRSVGRVSELTVRLPSALFAAATVAATVIGGAALVGEAPAILGGLLLAVMPVFYDEARTGRADAALAFLTSLCVLLFLGSPGRLGGPRRIAFFVLLGLATLTKGAAGLGLVVAVLAAEAAFGAGRRALRPLLHPAAVLAVVIGSSWYFLAAQHWGEAFVAQNLLGENLRHLVGGGFVSGERSFAFHLTHFRNVVTGTLPWGLFLPAAIVAAWRLPAGERRDAAMRLVRWLGAGLLFFTVAARKSPYYLL